MSEDPVGLWVPQPAGGATAPRERRAALRTFIAARPGTAAVVFTAVPVLIGADSVAAYYGFSPGPARKAMIVLAGLAALALALEGVAAVLWCALGLCAQSAARWRLLRQAHPAPAHWLVRPIRSRTLAWLVALVIRPPVPTRIRLPSAPRWRERWRFEVGDLDFGQN